MGLDRCGGAGESVAVQVNALLRRRKPAGSVSARSAPCRCLCALLVSLLLLPGCLTLLGGEQRVGDQAAVERETGVVHSPELEAYIRAIGERLAAESKRSGPWRFILLDDPSPNAFALPGGHLYVTRGLLALVNSEDELAGVIGHEIGHVLGGHGGKRVTLNAPFAILNGITSFTTGIVFPRLGRAMFDAGNALSQGFVVAPYSRRQELHADRIGQELAAAAGWDPRGISDFLETLERATALMLGEERRTGWLDTHPATDERVARTAARATELELVTRQPIARDRRELLDRLDGLIVGPDSSHGVRVDNRFVRPDWRVSIEFPEGWVEDGSAVIAVAQSASGDAMAALQVEGEGDDPRAAVRALEEEIGETIEVEEISIRGQPALRTHGSRKLRGGRLYFESTWVAIDGAVVRLISVCEERQSGVWRPTFDRIAQSLRAASAEEVASVHDTRLRRVTARAGEDAAELAALSSSVWSGPQIEVANAVATGHRFEAGALVKISRREPYALRPR